MKLPIPADWDGESWCRWSVCWPESEGWEGILRGFLTLPQRGWTWDERTGSILAVQEIGREITAANLPLNGVFMACNDTELTTAFNDIALALRYLADRQYAKPCCGGDSTSISVTAGYAGTVTQPVGGNVIPIYGDSPPRELLPDTTFPEGFESAEEWSLHKCSVANMIFDGVLYTCAFLASLTITNITGLAVLIGAGIAGILVFPPAGIAIMVGAVLAIGGFLGMFLSIRLELIERRDEFICIMYEAESVAVAISLIADLLDVVILAVPVGGLVAAAIKTILLLLFNDNALNQLFDSTADYLYPDADCAGCFECDPVERVWVKSDHIDFVGTEVTLVGVRVTASNNVPAENGAYYTGFNDENVCPFYATNIVTTGTGGLGKYQNCDGDIIYPVSWDEIIGIPILAISYDGSETPATIAADVEPAACP